MDRPNLESLSSETGYLIEVRDYALDVEARLGRAAAQLQKLYDLAGIAHHRILSSEQGLDEESKRLGNALVATRDLLASWEGEPRT